MSLAIIWFRRDLRLSDNPALSTALANHERVLPLYIHAPEEEQPFSQGAASDCWLHHALADLDRQLDGQLLTYRGPSLETLLQVADASGAEAVYWNRLYEPAVVARDTEVKKQLRAKGLQVGSSNAALLYEPWEIEKQAGGPFRVFTPYWKKMLTLGLPWPKDVPQPDAKQFLAPKQVPGLSLDDLGLLPSARWDQPMLDYWQATRSGAEARLTAFLDEGLQYYPVGRDQPAKDHVSRLSPYLHFGQLGPREIVEACARSNVEASDYLRELGWREFAHHLLFHFPETAEQPLDPRFTHFLWRDDGASLSAWQRGNTGVPMVDAGMRQLWATGWMHNRVRMIVASFLTKNLLLSWQDGAAWFWDTLVDADLASNTLGWQWTAGSGADAAPYFRVFNPVRQGEKFDPTGRYVRRWLPALSRLPDKWVHQPWAAPDEVLQKAGVALGRDYPRPLVDLAESRQRALAAWDTVKNKD